MKNGNIPQKMIFWPNAHNRPFLCTRLGTKRSWNFLTLSWKSHEKIMEFKGSEGAQTLFKWFLNLVGFSGTQTHFASNISCYFSSLAYRQSYRFISCLKCILCGNLHSYFKCFRFPFTHTSNAAASPSLLRRMLQLHLHSYVECCSFTFTPT